jgi:O-antigen ligase
MLITPVATPEFIVPTVDPQNPDIVGRVGSFGDVGSDSSVRIRIEFAERAIKDWRSHPIAGQGIGSFGQKYITSSADRAWLSNVFVRILHDGGVIGLALFTAALAFFAVRVLRIAWRRPDGETEILAVALGIAVAGMLIAFQATEGLQIAWYWWSLGLFAAALRLATQPDES